MVHIENVFNIYRYHIPCRRSCLRILVAFNGSVLDTSATKHNASESEIKDKNDNGTLTVPPSPLSTKSPTITYRETNSPTHSSTESPTTSPSDLQTVAPSVARTTYNVTNTNATNFTRLDGGEFEGDVLLGFPEAIAWKNYVYDDVWDTKILGPKKRMLGARNVGSQRKWPNNIIMYDLDTSFSAFMNKRIWNAMREIEANTCYTFKMIEPNQEKATSESNQQRHRNAQPTWGTTADI